MKHGPDDPDPTPPPKLIVSPDRKVGDLTAKELTLLIEQATEARFGRVFAFWLYSIPVGLLLSLIVSFVTCGLTRR